MRPPPIPPGRNITTCPTTGKRSYTERRTARDAIRAWHRNEPGMRPYRCDTCGWWHIGHLPAAVRAGQTTASDYYSTRDGGDPR